MTANLWHAVETFHQRKAAQYRPNPDLVDRLRAACRTLGVARWLEFPHLGITNDAELIQHTIECGARFLLILRKQSTYRMTSLHALVACAEMRVRLLAAGVEHESVSWLAAAQTIAGAIGEGWKTLPKFRAAAQIAIPYPLPGSGPEPAVRSESRSAIGTCLMQRATDQAVAEVTARDPDGMWLQFSHAFVQIVMNPSTGDRTVELEGER